MARWTARPERGRAEERDGLAVDGATVADSERMKRTAGKATPGRPGARGCVFCVFCRREPFR